MGFAYTEMFRKVTGKSNDPSDQQGGLLQEYNQFPLQLIQLLWSPDNEDHQLPLCYWKGYQEKTWLSEYLLVS